LIIAKKETFKERLNVNDVLTENELKMLNWADRSTIVVLDNYIIVNAHLSSKTDKNKMQIN
jgi:translation initiation factor IF-1